MDFLLGLFDTEPFNGRWYCGSGWQGLAGEILGYTHIVADLLIWGAYTAIPLVLAYFVSRRRDIPLPSIFWLFAMFIFACGTNHLVEALLFYQPVYRFSAVVKVFTAVVSWATVAALIPATPLALRLPGLAKINADLEREIVVRKHAEGELARTARTLETKNQDLTEFISIVTHDLKHPVFSIKTLQGLLKQRVYANLDEKERTYINLSLSECDRMMELLTQLSSLARIERTEVHLEEVDLHTFLGRCVERFRGQVTDSACTIDYNAPNERVMIARQQVEEALNNVIDNAIKHGCKGGDKRVTLDAKVASGEVTIGVSDRGPGIDPKHHKRVFQMFHRVSTDKTPGSGVGLAAVRRLMQHIGGEVRLESAPGRGARFLLTFPVGSASMPDASTSPSTVA